MIRRTEEASARLLAGLCAALLLAACKRSEPPAPPPPTERVMVVKSSEAPLLNEREADEDAAQVARAGDLLLKLKDLPAFASSWRGRMNERPAERSGGMNEVRQAPSDAVLYGFNADLGGEIEAPLTSWLCAQIARAPALAAAGQAPECAGLLRRTRLPDGALLAVLLCGSGPCPVALVRANEVKAVAVEGLSAARLAEAGGGLVLLATSHWVRDEGRWSGGTLIPLRLSGDAPERLAEIPLDEVDARNPATVISRMIRVEIGAPGPGGLPVHLVGERRETNRADGREIARSAIDETRVISAK